MPKSTRKTREGIFREPAAARAARSGTSGMRSLGPHPEVPSQDHQAAVERRTKSENPERASARERRSRASRATPGTARSASGKYRRSPLFGPTVRRQSPSSRGWVKRSPEYDANGRPKRTISKASHSAAGTSQPADAASARRAREDRSEPNQSTARTHGKSTIRIDLDRSPNPAAPPASAASADARRAEAPSSVARAAHAKAPPTQAAWSGSDQSDPAYAQRGDAIAAARIARLVPAAPAPMARARRPAAAAARRTSRIWPSTKSVCEEPGPNAFSNGPASAVTGTRTSDGPIPYRVTASPSGLGMSTGWPRAIPISPRADIA